MFWISVHHRGDLFDIAIEKAALVERPNQIIGDRVIARRQADVQIAQNRLVQRCRRGDANSGSKSSSVGAAAASSRSDSASLRSSWRQ